MVWRRHSSITLSRRYVLLSETIEKLMFDLTPILEKDSYFSNVNQIEKNAILPLLEFNILDFGLHKEE
ncbi:hypothetical protein TNCV_1082671 [Trichonephila clavipes]|nr:hypothetical protein TNCV_1082671 [Trichonephila clavipes]